MHTGNFAYTCIFCPSISCIFCRHCFYLMTFAHQQRERSIFIMVRCLLSAISCLYLTYFIILGPCMDINAHFSNTGYSRTESACTCFPASSKSIRDENNLVDHLKSIVTHSCDDSFKSSVEVTGLSASWTNDDNRMVLKNITFNLDHVSIFYH